MPLIDPSLQYFLLKNFRDIDKKKDDINFFLFYLRVASRNIYKNLATIEASIQFKKDLKDCIEFLADKLKCGVTEDDIDLPTIRNIYKYIYNKILLTDNEKRAAKLNGIYYTVNNRFHTKLFCLNIADSGRTHAWFLSDTPIAILCIETKYIYHYDKQTIFQSIKLEVDLMAAAGYKLVLIVDDCGTDMELLFQLIQSNQFSEVHYNIVDDFLKDNSTRFFKDIHKQKQDSLKISTVLYTFIHILLKKTVNITKE